MRRTRKTSPGFSRSTGPAYAPLYVAPFTRNGPSCTGLGRASSVTFSSPFSLRYSGGLASGSTAALGGRLTGEPETLENCPATAAPGVVLAIKTPSEAAAARWATWRKRGDRNDRVSGSVSAASAALTILIDVVFAPIQRR